MNTVINGRKIANDILKKLTLAWPKMKRAPSLGIIVVGEDPSSLSFIKEKGAAAIKIGIDYQIYRFPHKVSETRLIKAINKLLKKHSAWIVQLPLPKYISAHAVLNAIPFEKDPDMLSTHSWMHLLSGASLVPPCVAAAREIIRQHKIKLKGKHVAIIGFGRLVGQPIALWMSQQKAKVSVVNEHTKDAKRIMRAADIIVSGVGKAKLIKGSDIKKGAVLLDFGFAKRNGKISGDVDFLSAVKKAKYITPVPGGMGPLTVAMLMKNIVLLCR